MEDVLRMLAKKTGDVVNTSVNTKQVSSKLRHLLASHTWNIVFVMLTLFKRMLNSILWLFYVIIIPSIICIWKSIESTILKTATFSSFNNHVVFP